MRTEIAPEIEQNIIAQYKLGATQKSIQEKTGISTYLIKKILIKNNVPLRCPGNQYGRKYTVNDNYFSKQSSNMAYLLGLLASDGNVSKRENEVNIVASIIDKDFLDTIRLELNSSRPIREYVDNKGNHSCRLSINSKQIKQDLAKYNIIPAKTKKYQFSTLLDKKYWIDYIRGYIDGDGSITNNGKYLMIKLGCYNSELLEFIVNFLYSEYNIPKVNIYKYPNKHFYQIEYASESSKRIYEVLYTKNSLYLPRKKEKFENMIKK